MSCLGYSSSLSWCSHQSDFLLFLSQEKAKETWKALKASLRKRIGDFLQSGNGDDPLPEVVEGDTTRAVTEADIYSDRTYASDFKQFCFNKQRTALQSDIYLLYLASIHDPVIALHASSKMEPRFSGDGTHAPSAAYGQKHYSSHKHEVVLAVSLEDRKRKAAAAEADSSLSEYLKERTKSFRQESAQNAFVSEYLKQRLQTAKQRQQTAKQESTYRELESIGRLLAMDSTPASARGIFKARQASLMKLIEQGFSDAPALQPSTADQEVRGGDDGSSSEMEEWLPPPSSDEEPGER